MEFIDCLIKKLLIKYQLESKSEKKQLLNSLARYSFKQIISRYSHFTIAKIAKGKICRYKNNYEFLQKWISLYYFMLYRFIYWLKVD